MPDLVAPTCHESFVEGCFGKIRITILVADDTADEVVSQFRFCGFAVGKPYDHSGDEDPYKRDFDHYGEDDEEGSRRTSD